MKQKIDPEVFLRAADVTAGYYEILPYTCNNIDFVVNGDYATRAAETKFYQELFQIPATSTFGGMYHRLCGYFPSHDELRETRLLALCFAHEIALCKKQKKSHRGK